MKKLSVILQKLKSKSNICYKYYHLFDNRVQKIASTNRDFTINYIIYIVNSDFSLFFKKYQSIKSEAITDLFLERLTLNNLEKEKLFKIIFKNLFWLKINNVQFYEEDYSNFLFFIDNNSLDINRIFLENTCLTTQFFLGLEQLTGFNNLTFLNFDNNKMTDLGLMSLINFLLNNNIKLEYLSLINNGISSITKLGKYLLNSDIRILDLSSNVINDQLALIEIIENSFTLNELYLKNIELEDSILDQIVDVFKKGSTNIYVLKLSLNKNQFKLVGLFKELGEQLDINFDIDCLCNDYPNIYSTIYIKQLQDVSGLEGLINEYFYLFEDSISKNNFDILINKNDVYLNNAINLFLFDFHNYKLIDYLLEKYSFNYLYIENYYITNEDFLYFINSIEKQSYKKYKVNLISIEINEYQLNYLINNCPKNIYYIEINLNKIELNREIYISRMLKNDSFIFDNMEFYKKIFK